MASDAAVNVAKIVLSATNSYGTHKGGVDGNAVQLLATQLDCAIELIQNSKGKPDPKVLGLIIFKKTLAIGGMATYQMEVAQCMVSVGQMGVSLATLAVVAAPTGGLGAFAAALSLLSDTYGIYANCKEMPEKTADAIAQEVSNHPTARRIFVEMLNFFRVPL